MVRRPSRLMIYLLLLPAGYLVICAVLFFRQNGMIFLPSVHSTADLERQAAAEGFAPWTNAAGRQIGWQSQQGNPDQVLLVFNGNAGCALDRTHYRQYCLSKGDWKTFLLEYPGYGNREGQPSEKSVTAAAVEAIDTLAARPGRTIWLLGESLGTGPACAAVKARPDDIAGLLLVTPFNSLVAAARHHYPWLPVNLLLTTRFNSQKNLAKYPGPAAFFLGANDKTVPAALGQKLYDGYPGRKRLWIAPNAGHDVSGMLDAEWPQIVKWLQGNIPDPKK